MKTTNVATLKQNLSAYLHLVEQGDEIVVTSHQRRIARLIPESGSGERIRPPTLPISVLLSAKGIKPVRSVSATDLLLADRERR